MDRDVFPRRPEEPADDPPSWGTLLLILAALALIISSIPGCAP